MLEECSCELRRLGVGAPDGIADADDSLREVPALEGAFGRVRHCLERLSEVEPVSVWINDVDFANAPCLIGGRHFDRDAIFNQRLV